MGTSGVELLVTAFRALAPEERDEVYERIRELRLEELAGRDSEMATHLRSLKRVAEEVGGVPTIDDYKLVAGQLREEGADIEPFSRLYRFFGTWPRALEALGLEEYTTPRRISARFRARKLGKVARYDEEVLRAAVESAVAHYGCVPTTKEFDWWREHQLQLAEAAGEESAHLPSVGPYRHRWGSWEAALLHFGYDEAEVKRRLVPKNCHITRGWSADGQLPTGLPMAALDTASAELDGWSEAELARLLGAWGNLPRRSRYILTTRHGLLGEPVTLRHVAAPLGLSLHRVRQLQLEATEHLAAACAGHDGDIGQHREAALAALRLLAVRDTT